MSCKVAADVATRLGSPTDSCNGTVSKTTDVAKVYGEKACGFEEEKVSWLQAEVDVGLGECYRQHYHYSSQLSLDLVQREGSHLARIGRVKASLSLAHPKGERPCVLWRMQ